jgi:Cdc6-like AAA superfamily ATPase
MDQLFDILAADSSRDSNNDRNNEEVLEEISLRMDKVEGELRGLIDKIDVLIALVTQQNRA